MSPTFLKRVLSSVLALLFVVLAFCYTDALQFKIFLTLVLLYGAYEWACLVSRNMWLRGVSWMLSVLALWLGIWFVPSMSLEMSSQIYRFNFYATVIMMLPIAGSFFYSKIFFFYRRTLFWLLSGFCLMFGLASASMLLTEYGEMPILLLLCLIPIWANDIAAYCVGSQWGKNHLSCLSPGKTLEGYVAGVGAVFFCLIFYYMLFYMHHWTISILPLLSILFLLISICLSLVLLIGDLFESALKRHAGVKDSGYCLPGHGGLLDRLDSLLLLFPILAYIMGGILA